MTNSTGIPASRAAAAFYDPEIRFTFSVMATSSLRDGAPLPEPAGSAWDRLVTARPGGTLDASGHVPASAPSMTWMPAEGLHRLTLAYGVDDGAWREARTAGVCFAIYTADGLGTALWRSCLDPLDRSEDRGSHAMSLDLPPGSTELGL